MSEKVVITVTKDGQIKIEGQGFAGPTCTPVIEELKEAIGGDVIEEEDTEEMFYAVIENQEHEQVGGGW